MGCPALPCLLARALAQQRHTLEYTRFPELLQEIVVLFTGAVNREKNSEAFSAGAHLHRFRGVVRFFEHAIDLSHDAIGGGTKRFITHDKRLQIEAPRK